MDPEETVQYPDESEGDLQWDKETIFIIIWCALIFVIMCSVLIIMCLKTKAYQVLAEHKRKVGRNHKLNPGQRPTKVVGFFHPNCDDGAGGEKVLWQAVKALQNYNEDKQNKFNIQVLIYSNSKLTADEII